MAKTDLTPQAMEGFQAGADASCPYLASSDSSNAWHVGRWLCRTGRSAPRGVRASRGCTMHANDMLVDVTDVRHIERRQ